jgi:hypothetical protein
MALILSGGDGGNATITGNSANLSIANAGNVLVSAATISASGNITGNFILGNGSLLTGISAGGGGGLTWQNVITANTTVSSGNAYAVSTVSGPVVITLPSSPGAGNTVQLTDYARTWGANAVTINRNSSNIAGAAANVTVNTNGASVALVYIDAAQGWIAFNGFSTPPVGAYTVSYLLVAGGGGGGTNANANNDISGGGGGAGGLLSTTTSFIPGTAYTITIGAGGTGTTTSANGSNSAIVGVNTAIGGGFGHSWSGSAYIAPSAGGSGGGGGYGATPGAAGTAGQGNSGGNGATSTNYPGGGGGGSSAVGGNFSGTTGGVGGAGTASSISGSSVTYAGGGGGGSNTGGSGGAGGGGAGGGQNANGTNGSGNTGGGGGGSGFPNPGSVKNGGSGGSGICVISYLGSQRGTGGTVTSSGGYTIHTFTSSGTYTA